MILKFWYHATTISIGDLFSLPVFYVFKLKILVASDKNFMTSVAKIILLQFFSYGLILKGLYYNFNNEPQSLARQMPLQVLETLRGDVVLNDWVSLGTTTHFRSGLSTNVKQIPFL